MTKKKISLWTSDVFPTFAVNMVIAVIIAVILSFYSNNSFFTSLFFSTLFSNLIGFSIYSLFLVAERRGIYSHDHPKFRRTVTAFGVTLTGIIFGTTVGLLFFKFVMGYRIFLFSKGMIFVYTANLVIAFVVVMLMMAFGKLERDLEKKIRENEEITHLQTRTQLMVLQSKINPHFLFNTLNTIVDMVYSDPAKVETMVLNLSDIYRRVLGLEADKRITLGDELDLIRKYLEIEKIRMGERLEYDMDADPDTLGVRIPSLMVEPIVENAVIHGVGPKTGGGRIRIRICRNNDITTIVISDNGVGTADSFTPGFGLMNVQNRLRLIYGERSRFSIQPGVNGGTDVIMEIPDED